MSFSRDSQISVVEVYTLMYVFNELFSGKVLKKE
jgi:hypothetical protein